MNVTANIDTRAFDQACREYAQATGKTAEAVGARQLKNWCIQAYKLIPLASLGKIARVLPQGTNNIRLVAWALRKYVERKGPYQKAPGGFDAKGRAFDVKVGKRTNRKTGKVTKVTRVYRRYGRFYTQTQAQVFAKKWFNRRKSAVSFTRGFMGAILRSLGGSGSYKAGQTARSHKSVSDAAFAVGAVSSYDYRNDVTGAVENINPTRVEVIVQNALETALPATVRDIEIGTAKALERAWNAKRAVSGSISLEDAAKIMAA
jgi:hypothetical protein